MNSIRACRDDEFPVICSIVNAAAEAYRGVIPDDCFHDPYMPLTKLQAEIAAGVAFSGYEAFAELVGDLNAPPMRRLGVSRRDLFLELDRPAPKELPAEPLVSAARNAVSEGNVPNLSERNIRLGRSA